jgi:hypothetical protein
MAPPPNGLRAHDGTCFLPPEFDELIEPLVKLLGQCVVGVVVKTLISPKSVHAAVEIFKAAAPPTQLRDVFVTKAVRLQIRGQRVFVIIRIRARARNRSNIDDRLNARLLQQSDELLDRSCRMPDREKRKSHRDSFRREDL